MQSNKNFYDRSIKNFQDSDGYDESGESEFTRERADPYQMIDYLIDQGINYRGLGPKNYQRADYRIYDDVAEILLRNPTIDASEIEVYVNQGNVFLRGYVASRKIKRLAELVVENIPGVRDIHNQLSFY